MAGTKDSIVHAEPGSPTAIPAISRDMDADTIVHAEPGSPTAIPAISRDMDGADTGNGPIARD